MLKGRNFDIGCRAPGACEVLQMAEGEQLLSTHDLQLGQNPEGTAEKR